MIRRANRFHGHNSVSNVRGEVAHGRFMSIRYAKNKKSDYRLAVVVSKKVAPGAVVRNRIRRRLFELVRTQRRIENAPVDMVLYVKAADVATVPSEILSAEVVMLTKKALQQLTQDNK